MFGYSKNFKTFAPLKLFFFLLLEISEYLSYTYICHLYFHVSLQFGVCYIQISETSSE